MTLTRENVFSRGTLTIARVVAEYSLSRSKVKELIHEGRLPYSQLDPGGNYLIPRLALDLLLGINLVGLEEDEEAGLVKR